MKEVVSGEFEKTLQYLTTSYVELSQLNEAYVEQVKKHFREFNKFRESLREDMAEIDRLVQVLRQELERERRQRERAVTNKENKDISDFFQELGNHSQRAEEELKRRILFNRKLNFLQSLGDKLTAQEEARRRQFLNEGSCDIKWLGNHKTPWIEVELEGCSDPEVIKEMRKDAKQSSNTSIEGSTVMMAEEFMVW